MPPAKWNVQGYAWAEDKEHCEEYGRMLQADPSKVSQRAKKRGLPQVNTPLPPTPTPPSTYCVCSSSATAHLPSAWHVHCAPISGAFFLMYDISWSASADCLFY